MLLRRLPLTISIVLAVRVAAAVDLTECGQVIEAGQVARLRADLACGPRPTWPVTPTGVHLRSGARIALNGFTISGDGSGVGIACGDPGRAVARCTIKGPGEIRNFWAGVNCGGCKVVARDVTFRANVNGIYVPLAGKLIAKRVVASDNAGDGIWAQGVRAKDVAASHNGGVGVKANAGLRLRRLEATANGAYGVVGGVGRGRIVDSVVTGNDVEGGGYDVVSTGRVRLTRTTCGRSGKLRYLSQEEFEVVGSFGCADD